MIEPSNHTLLNKLRDIQLVCIALLLGQFVFAIGIVVAQQTGAWESSSSDPEMMHMLAIVGIAVGAASIPTAYTIRKALWQRGAGEDTTKILQAFFIGNIAFQAVLEGASFLNLTFWLVSGTMLPHVPVFAVLFTIGVTALLRTRVPAD
jgi:hypothetical protein